MEKYLDLEKRIKKLKKELENAAKNLEEIAELNKELCKKIDYILKVTKKR